jgi:hypothetical protein
MFGWSAASGVRGSATMAPPPLYTAPSFFRTPTDATPFTQREREAAVAEMLRLAATPFTQPHAMLCFAAAPSLRADVSRHYRPLAQLVHPDKAVGVPRATEAFQALEKARQTLLSQCRG